MDALKPSGIFWTKFVDLTHSAAQRPLNPSILLHRIKTERKIFQAKYNTGAEDVIYQNVEPFIIAIKNSKETKRTSKFKTQNIGLETMGGCISKKKGE